MAKAELIRACIRTMFLLYARCRKRLILAIYLRWPRASTGAFATSSAGRAKRSTNLASINSSQLKAFRPPATAQRAKSHLFRFSPVGSRNRHYGQAAGKQSQWHALLALTLHVPSSNGTGSGETTVAIQHPYNLAFLAFRLLPPDGAARIT